MLEDTWPCLLGRDLAVGCIKHRTMLLFPEVSLKCQVSRSQACHMLFCLKAG